MSDSAFANKWRQWTKLVCSVCYLSYDQHAFSFCIFFLGLHSWCYHALVAFVTNDVVRVKEQDHVIRIVTKQVGAIRLNYNCRQTVPQVRVSLCYPKIVVLACLGFPEILRSHNLYVQRHRPGLWRDQSHRVASGIERLRAELDAKRETRACCCAFIASLVCGCLTVAACTVTDRCTYSQGSYLSTRRRTRRTAASLAVCRCTGIEAYNKESESAGRHCGSRRPCARSSR